MNPIALTHIFLACPFLALVPSQAPKAGPQATDNPTTSVELLSTQGLNADDPALFDPSRVYREAPPWKHGPTQILGEGTGFFLTSFHESSRFDVDTNFAAQAEVAINSGEVGFTMSGVSVGMTTNNLAVELLLGSASFEERQGAETETDNGLVAAGRASLNMYQEGRLAWGTDIALLVGSVTMDGFSSAIQGAASTDLRWVQADLRTAISYVPSSRSLFSLAPMAGVGFRLIDGVQKAPVGDLEFDAELIYLTGGLSANWRPTNDLQVGFETQAMLGQIEGLSFSLNLSF